MSTKEVVEAELAGMRTLAERKGAMEDAQLRAAKEKAEAELKTLIERLSIQVQRTHACACMGIVRMCMYGHRTHVHVWAS